MDRFDEFDGTEDDDHCPIDGDQLIVEYGSTGGPDPYSINRLQCGHSVVCYGPGEPNVIVRFHR